MWLKIFLLMSAIACLLAGNIPQISAFQIQDFYFRTSDFAGFFWAGLCCSYATDSQVREPRRKGARFYFVMMALVILALTAANLIKHAKH
jgi:peptidoglycan/LPS O-acetylase OafA/YrhL